jgi:hypothetical protein
MGEIADVARGDGGAIGESGPGDQGSGMVTGWPIASRALRTIA